MRMFLLFKFILLSFSPFVLPYYTSWEVYRDYLNAKLVPGRIITLMESYIHRATAKVEEMTPYMGLYDKSPHFEIGYIMSELLERYKKMIENTKRPMNFTMDSVFQTLKMNEIVQKLFFEIFHLVNMVHEIPRKYSDNIDFADPERFKKKQTLDPIVEEVEKEKIKYEIKEREREEKRSSKKVKVAKELQDVIDEEGTRKPRRPGNKWWPIDYGWEIDYYW